VGGTLYYLVSGNRITPTQTPYRSNGEKKYFQLYDNIVNYDATAIPFSDIAPGRYWVYGALEGKNGAPLGPVAARAITIEQRTIITWGGRILQPFPEGGSILCRA
jgi:hypothetical protein